MFTYLLLPGVVSVLDFIFVEVVIIVLFVNLLLFWQNMTEINETELERQHIVSGVSGTSLETFYGTPGYWTTGRVKNSRRRIFGTPRVSHHIGFANQQHSLMLPNVQ